MFWKPQTILCFSPLSSFCGFRRLAAVDSGQQSCQLGLALSEASLNDITNNLASYSGRFFIFFLLSFASVFHSLLFTWLPPLTWCPKLKHGTVRETFEPKTYLLWACWCCTEETNKPEFPACVCVCVLGGAFHLVRPTADQCTHRGVMVTLCSVIHPALLFFHCWL